MTRTRRSLPPYADDGSDSRREGAVVGLVILLFIYFFIGLLIGAWIW